MGVSCCKYLFIFFCDFNTMYHRIVVAFIKQTINIQRKENERLESCLPLWAAGKILFCFVVFTTDMISLYHVLSIIKGRLYLFIVGGRGGWTTRVSSSLIRQTESPLCHPGIVICFPETSFLQTLNSVSALPCSFSLMVNITR